MWVFNDLTWQSIDSRYEACDPLLTAWWFIASPHMIQSSFFGVSLFFTPQTLRFNNLIFMSRYLTVLLNQLNRRGSFRHDSNHHHAYWSFISSSLFFPLSLHFYFLSFFFFFFCRWFVLTVDSCRCCCCCNQTLRSSSCWNNPINSPYSPKTLTGITKQREYSHISRFPCAPIDTMLHHVSEPLLMVFDVEATCSL